MQRKMLIAELSVFYRLCLTNSAVWTFTPIILMLQLHRD